MKFVLASLALSCGLARLIFEDDPAQWGSVVSPVIGQRIHSGRSQFSLETGVEMVCAEKNRFGAVPVRVVFPL